MIDRRVFLSTLSALAMISAPALAEDSPAPEVIEMTLGSDDAPITMIEYASFTCPHCANFHKDVFPRLREDYIDTGKVKFIYREVYFDRVGLWASIVARCGGEEKFFGISSQIFSEFKSWFVPKDMAATADNLRRYGRVAGLTDDQLNACLTDEGNARALVGWFQENAKTDEITATPSFVIDGEKVSNKPYEDLKAILDRKLAG
ncbi:MAG: DsbA family protein [Mangrovicoccus sp.]